MVATRRQRGDVSLDVRHRSDDEDVPEFGTSSIYVAGRRRAVRLEADDNTHRIGKNGSMNYPGQVEVLTLTLEDQGERPVGRGALITANCAIVHSDEIVQAAGVRYGVRLQDADGSEGVVYPVDDVRIAHEPGEPLPLVGLHLRDSAPGPYAPLPALKTGAGSAEAAQAFRARLAGQEPDEDVERGRPHNNILCMLFGGSFCLVPGGQDPGGEVLD